MLVTPPSTPCVHVFNHLVTNVLFAAQEETGIQTIEEMTVEFSTTEERNFSLINIINDLNRV